MKTSENIISGSQVHEPAMQWQADLMEHLREWDGKYGPTYLVPWQPWHVTPMTGDLGWTSWTCRFLWLPYKRCVYYCRLDQWCLILIPFSVMISSSQSSVKSFGIIPLNPIQKDASVTQFCIRSSSVEVLDLLQKARDSYRVERTTFTNNDKLHWCVHVQFCFFLDCNGSQWIPIQSQDVSNCGQVSFPCYRSSTPATPRERASWSCARKSMCRRPVGKSYHFPQVSYLSNMGNEKKTKNVARFSSELSKAIQFQGKVVSKY